LGKTRYVADTTADADAGLSCANSTAAKIVADLSDKMEGINEE